MTAPDADGWIEWSGGECPVHAEAVTPVRFRNGSVFNSAKAKYHSWHHRGSPVDIVRYRIVEPRP